ncbi:MAG: ATP-binding protein, partial [Syntrophorhabdaceae bacterium]|nr:ATP-binding protein [Syntrophorhabdaceae bacterium]
VYKRQGIFQATREGKILVVNPALSRMLGYESPEECLSTIWNVGYQHYVDPSARDRLISLLEEKGLVIGFECELYRKDRTKIWVSMNVRGIFDKEGRFIYQEGSIEDITAKKIAQDELRRLSEFNKAIIDNAPVAIFTLDKNGVFTSVNPALARLSGLGEKAEKKLIGFNWLENPYTVSSGLADYIKKGLAGESFHLWDFPFVTYKGDRNLYMDFKGVPLFGKDGSVEGLLCIIEETTERVKTRAKLMQEIKMATLGRLVAGVAHELNNPLATLVAYAELARSTMDNLNEHNINKSEIDELKASLEIIQEQAFRCKNAINDLLNIPRKNGLEKTPIEINNLIENIVETLIPDNGKIKIEKDLDPSLPCARGDTSAIRQVFINVLKNAIDAVEERTDAKILIKTSFYKNNLSVEISDNGVGIPNSIIDKIFEPFFTTKELKKGIGLGLSLCKELLEEMGGAITVKSTPRIGTTFIINLPAEKVEA